MSSRRETELQCAEVYYRTVIMCDEARMVSALLERWNVRVTLAPPFHDIRDHLRATTHSSSVGGLDIDNSASFCCNRKEIESGVCKYSAEAAASVLKMHQFNTFHRTLRDRLRAASGSMKASYEDFQNQSNAET